MSGSWYRFASEVAARVALPRSLRKLPSGDKLGGCAVEFFARSARDRPQDPPCLHCLEKLRSSTIGFAQGVGIGGGYSTMPLAIQLAHAGRKASSQAPWEGGQLIPEDQGGWQTVAPSAVPHGPTEPPPTLLDEAGLFT